VILFNLNIYYVIDLFSFQISGGYITLKSIPKVIWEPTYLGTFSKYLYEP
jgi:hypothetical protein